MIRQAWIDFGPALLLAWALLATVWQWALPRGKTRLIDRIYPLAPLVMVALLAHLPTDSQPFVFAWLQAGLWLWAWLTLVWLISLVKKDASIMDIAYGLLLLALPWWLHAHLGEPWAASSICLLALTTLGFGRYSIFILWRNLPHGEDPRYARWRERAGPRWWWFSYLQVFLLQGVVIWAWAVPLVLVLISPAAIGPWHLAGALVWTAGFVFEAGGDWQLARFRRRRREPGQLLDTGLWSLTRHPNYFGHACMWWGYALIAMGHPLGWLALAPAAYVTWFMYSGSATSLMERHMARTKPGHEAYCARVPAFFPRWPLARDRGAPITGDRP